MYRWSRLGTCYFPNLNLPIDPLPSASALAKAASNFASDIFFLNSLYSDFNRHLIRIYKFLKGQMSYVTFDRLLMPHFTIYDCKWQGIYGILCFIYRLNKQTKMIWCADFMAAGIKDKVFVTKSYNIAGFFGRQNVQDVRGTIRCPEHNTRSLIESCHS